MQPEDLGRKTESLLHKLWGRSLAMPVVWQLGHLPDVITIGIVSQTRFVSAGGWIRQRWQAATWRPYWRSRGMASKVRSTPNSSRDYDNRTHRQSAKHSSCAAAVQFFLRRTDNCPQTLAILFTFRIHIVFNPSPHR